MDKLTIERIQLLHPKLRKEAAEIYAEICAALTGRAMCRFSYTLRTFAEQDKLYAKGRTEPGPVVTKAKGGLSYHNYGLAVDIVLIIDADGDGKHEKAAWDMRTDFDADGRADWMEVVTIFKQHGWTWGGDWKFADGPHFEKAFGFSVRQLLSLHKLQKVAPGGYVKI